MLLENKVIIITGAGGGLGKGIAKVCHREGGRVILADIRGDAAQQVAEQLGECALAVPCDVSSEQDLHNLVETVLATFGRIDGLVNNAGINFAKPFLDTTAEEWDHVLRVDLRAVFCLTQQVCRRMVKQEPSGGSIVNISSVHSLAALPGAGPYDAAKCGVVGLSKSIAVELASQNIRVNIVSPGLLNTDIWQTIIDAAPSEEECLAYWKSNIPIGRVIDPEEIGETVAFLLSDRSGATTGSNILVDGGMTSQLISKEPYQAKAIEG